MFRWQQWNFTKYGSISLSSNKHRARDQRVTALAQGVKLWQWKLEMVTVSESLALQAKTAELYTDTS